MKPLNQWLLEYGESHQNPTNKKIHNFAVPAIMFSILGLFWCIPKPGFFPEHFLFNWCTLFVLLTTVYYILLGIFVAVGMLLVSALMMVGIYFIESAALPLLTICIALFIVAWVFQFIGHKIEGKKPSFFEDLLFLLIGPVWVAKGLFPFLFKK